MITIRKQIECVEREIAMRERVYPRWVAAGKMTSYRATQELETMRPVLATLEHSEHDEGGRHAS